MQLVLHAPFGSRINKAWGLALRKRFCRQFNFELQAAATEDALLLSLGPQHSFPLADVFRYLHPATARDVLVQAFLDAPVFQTRWRWNTTISLAVPRNRGGKKVAAAAAADAGRRSDGRRVSRRRRLPREHSRRSRDSRSSAGQRRRSATASRRRWTSTGSRRCSTRIHARRDAAASRATRRSRRRSSHEILNARPYAFLDDAPLEERRTQAVYARRASEPSRRGRPGRARRRGDRARARRGAARPARRRRAARRAADRRLPDRGGRAAMPRRALRRSCRRRGGRRHATIREFRIPTSGSRPSGCRSSRAVHPTRTSTPAIAAPPSRAARVWTREEAIVELLRGRLTIVGPTTARALAGSLGDRRGRRRRGAARARIRGRRAARSFHRQREPAHLNRTAGSTLPRMVRPPAARAHPSLHAQPAARRDRAGQPGRLHAVPVRLAARRRRRAG